MKLGASSAVITGGSRGIGLATARALARKGVRLALVARNREVLERAARELGAEGIVADLADPKAIAPLAEEIRERLGSVDILVNNAALAAPLRVLDMTDKSLRAYLECDLLSPMRLVHEFLPEMVERRRGHIVNVSSGAAALAMAGMTNYCAAKAGLLHYTASLRSEISHFGIGTTAVELGTVPTDLYQQCLENQRLFELHTKLTKLRLMRDTPAEVVADKIVRAIEENRPYVRVPATAALAWRLNSAVRDLSYFVFREKP